MAPGVQDEYVHKNRLQQISLRLFAQIPTFETPNEGLQHDPKFRPTVVVDGTKFTSPLTFNRRKDAEQHVSKIALEHLYTDLKKNGHLQINSTTTFCKSILHEFAAKKKISFPVYTTSNVEGMLPMFKTSVTFDGNTFNGSLSRNKKDAEQFGARSVIQWILDQPDDRSIAIAEIIRTKHKLFKETHEDRNLTLANENNPPSQTIVNGHPSYTQGPAAADAVPPTLEVFKGKLVATELPVAVFDSQNAEIKSNKSAAVDLASKSVNQISVNSCIGQTVKVEVEESFEASPSTVNGQTEKRSRRKNKRGSAKKLRMDECTLAGVPM